MNKTFIIIFTAFVILSCKKETYTDAPSPDWLKQRIAADEEVIRNSPLSGLDAAAWIRYEWQGNYFYDYINLNNSAGPETYSYYGDRIFLTEEASTQYHAERCCEVVVWKGAKYQ